MSGLVLFVDVYISFQVDEQVVREFEIEIQCQVHTAVCLRKYGLF